jgi:arginase
MKIDGLLESGLLERGLPMPHMIKLLGIPYDANSSFLRGPAMAPPRIRMMETEGSANRFAENGMEILHGKSHEDLGDMSLTGLNREEAHLAIQRRVSQEINSGAKLLTLGGDHSVSFPVIRAHAEKYNGLHILHLDAHADLYDNFDDNPYSHASPFARLMEQGGIGSLTQVGIRTLSTHQREQAARFGVKIVEMNQFSLDFLPGLQAPLYISLDLDVLDPAYAPGLSHHEPGGLPTRGLIHILQSIPVPIVGADIVEYNPVRDIHDITAMVAYKLMKEMIAQMAQ